MIKKQLGVLAGSIALAASANAAIVAGTIGATGVVGTDSSAILVLSTAGQGAFVIDTGLTASQLAAGQGFTADISAASAFLGGSIDSYALFGTLGGASNAYVGSVGYVDNGSGVVYAQSTAGGVQTFANLTGARQLLNDYITSVAVGGGFADGTLGDFDAQGIAPTLFGVGALNGSAVLSSLFAQTSDAGGVSNQSGVTILAPGGAQDGAYIAPEGQFNVSAVPVPAAAWLFGSALLGLGVVRRKS